MSTDTGTATPRRAAIISRAMRVGGLLSKRSAMTLIPTTITTVAMAMPTHGRTMRLASDGSCVSLWDTPS